jgi:hypothetical protein
MLLSKIKGSGTNVNRKLLKPRKIIILLKDQDRKETKKRPMARNKKQTFVFVLP